MTSSVTNKTYGFASLYSALVVGVLLVGFHLTYTVYFPSFRGFQWVQHVHGACMLSWVLLLLIQPLLLYYKKNRLHRSIGKLSYLLAPLMMVSIFLVTKMVYFRTLPQGQEAAIASMSNSIPDLIGFAVLYTLAMAYRKKPQLHMRFMISTSFLMIGPGLGRALATFGGMEQAGAISLSNRIVLAIILLFIANDFRMRAYRLSPYWAGLLAIGFMYLSHVNNTGPAWQAFAGFIADRLF